MLSSLHHEKKIVQNYEQKPEIIHFYNKNKMGSDAFDQLCANNTCRMTNRWPLMCFATLKTRQCRIHVFCKASKILEERV